MESETDMPRYYVTIPVAFSLSVEVESDEELTCTKEAHRLALERLEKDDGFLRLQILDKSGKKCEIARASSIRGDLPLD